jgi:hypothetical protein
LNCSLYGLRNNVKEEEREGKIKLLLVVMCMFLLFYNVVEKFKICYIQKYKNNNIDTIK